MMTKSSPLFRKATVTLEIVGIVVVGTGIGVELMMREAVGAVIITTGSVFVAIGAFLYAKIYPRERN